MSVLVLGSVNKDHVYTVERIVKPGETVPCLDYGVFWGGKGLNQSIALKKAGADVFFACKASRADAAELRALFLSHGLPDTWLSAESGVTGHAIIQIDRDGQNSIIIYHGANYEMQPEWIDRVLGDFGKGDWLLLQNEINNPDYIIRQARGRGMHIALNPSPFDESLRSLRPIDMFILNELECEAFTHTSQTDKMLDAMAREYPEAQIILTLGENGVIYADGTTHLAYPAYPVNAVDTTAAGDTFTGFFLAEYIRCGQAERALQLATKAAALCVTAKGAVNSIPDLATAEAFRWPQA